MAADTKTITDPFLASIEAKIAAWTAVLATYRSAAGLDGPLGDGGIVLSGVGAASGVGSVVARSTGGELPVGIFRGKSIKEAIEIYLNSCGRKQTNKEIAAGLRKGGIATTSRHFEPTVGTALHRMRTEGIILRFPDGWDLAAHYPDSLRQRLEKGDRKPSAKKKSGTRAKGKVRGPKALASHDAEHDTTKPLLAEAKRA